MQTPTADEVKDQAKQVAGDAATAVQETAREQWQLLREKAPEILYSSVAEAVAGNARRTEANLAYYRQNPSLIGRRLRELDDEWDTRRMLQVATSGLSLAGFWLTMTKSRLWTLLPMALAGGALHHGLTDESPAEDLARRLGFRTRGEIEYERRALMRLDLELGRDQSLLAQTTPETPVGI
jgi:hypothetical protein